MLDSSQLPATLPYGHLDTCVANYAGAVTEARASACRKTPASEWTVLDLRQSGANAVRPPECVSSAAAGAVEDDHARRELEGMPNADADPAYTTVQREAVRVESLLATHSKALHIVMALLALLRPLVEAARASAERQLERRSGAGTKPSAALASLKWASEVEPHEDGSREAVPSRALLWDRFDCRALPRGSWAQLAPLLAQHPPGFKAIVFASSHQLLNSVQIQLDEYFGEAAVARYLSSQRDSANLTRFHRLPS